MNVVDLDTSLDWTPFDIPGGSAPVQMHVLRDEPATRARTLLVRFPKGWERFESGFYESAEELIVLEGALHLCGITFGSGDWGFVPEKHGRYDMSVDEPTVVFARFFGPARWVASEVHEELPLHRALSAASFEDASPLGAGNASLLRLDEAWLVSEVPAGVAAPVDTELLSLPSRHWTWTPAGEPLPDLAPPAFCRRFAAEGGAT
ncbi:MAG: cupin domain-containing protein [Actinomycetota bacterium]